MQRLHTRHTYVSCLDQSCPFYWSLRFIRVRPVSWCQWACLSAWWGFSVNYLGKPDRRCVYVFLNCVCLCQAVWTLPPVCAWQVMKPDWGNKQEVCGWRLVVLLEADSSCCHSGMFIPMMGLNPWCTHTWLHVHIQICAVSPVVYILPYTVMQRSYPSWYDFNFSFERPPSCSSQISLKGQIWGSSRGVEGRGRQTGGESKCHPS